jgi:hypothetical protein
MQCSELSLIALLIFLGFDSFVHVEVLDGVNVVKRGKAVEFFL